MCGDRSDAPDERHRQPHAHRRVDEPTERCAMSRVVGPLLGVGQSG